MNHTRKIKVLLVEDEITLAKIIRDTLETLCFEVRLACDGEEGLKCFFASRPDVVVSDIMMPKLSGLDLVRKIRESDSTTPVLFLTAKTTADDVVEGFENGANDYLRKPFAIKELIVRIKALVDRISVEDTPQETIFQIGDYEFDAVRGILRYLPTGGEEQLPNREAEVLGRFCRNSGALVPTQNILLELWGNDDFFCTRSLQVLITRIRHRLSKDERIQILNIRGIGYKLMAD